MSDFQNYLLAQERTRHARAEAEGASAKVELAVLRERLAECRSQSLPINGIEDLDRPAALKLVRYIETGRMEE